MKRSNSGTFRTDRVVLLDLKSDLLRFRSEKDWAFQWATACGPSASFFSTTNGRYLPRRYVSVWRMIRSFSSSPLSSSAESGV